MKGVITNLLLDSYISKIKFFAYKMQKAVVKKIKKNISVKKNIYVNILVSIG